jgi:hypothetical protein
VQVQQHHQQQHHKYQHQYHHHHNKQQLLLELQQQHLTHLTPPRVTTNTQGSGAACVLPGTTGATTCACTAVSDSTCGNVTRTPTQPTLKQWLMIGDSISEGCYPVAKSMAVAKGIEVRRWPPPVGTWICEAGPVHTSILCATTHSRFQKKSLLFAFVF